MRNGFIVRREKCNCKCGGACVSYNWGMNTLIAGGWGETVVGLWFVLAEKPWWVSALLGAVALIAIMVYLRRSPR